MRVPKQFKLKIHWSDKENDFVISYPRSSDGHFLHSAVLSKRYMTMFRDSQREPNYNVLYPVSSNPNINLCEWDWIRDLEDRGFDKRTLKFEVTIKRDLLAEKFSHLWDDLTDKEKAEVEQMGFTVPKKD